MRRTCQRNVEELVEGMAEEKKQEGVNSRNVEIAKNMLNEDIPINSIIKCTGLSKEKIESLK